MSSSIKPFSAQLSWDSSGQPISTRYNDVYFSREHGLAKSRYTFLQQNALAERWRAGFPQKTFYIGETGFGSALNFLAAWQLWEQNAAADKQLHYIAVENEALRRSDLLELLSLWPELADCAQALLAVYPQLPTPGFHPFAFAEGRIKLTLIIADPSAGLNQLLKGKHPLYSKPFHPGMDAWFLNGFAPDKNLSMWRPEVIDALAALSRPQTTLAASTATPQVAQALERVGFRTEKRPGYSNADDVLVASYAGEREAQAENFATGRGNSPYPVPWHVTEERRSNTSATVIGAGLAGSHTARALAERGWQVKVLEQANSIASGASGNAQGIVYGKLSRDMDGLAQFNLASLLYAQRFYRDYWQNPELGEQCGLLQLAFSAKEQKIQQQLQSSFAGADDFLQFLSPSQASDIAGVTIESSCSYFPQLGWLRPKLLCQELLNHPNISVQCNTSVAALEPSETAAGWRLMDACGQLIVASPHVVIANAHHALNFSSTSHLPLKPIRGQVSHFPGELIPTNTVLCSDGYIAPATEADTNKLQSFGATFTLHENRPEVLLSDHRKNLANLSASMPGLAPVLEDVDPSILSGRASFRCTTADYLPLLGPAPDYSRFLETFQALRRNAKASIPSAGPYLPGLYMNVGHGSRGLAYTPLAGELLAATMSGDVLPIPRDLATALNPARFIIRDLIRNRLKT